MPRPRFYTYKKNVPGDARFAKGLGYYRAGDALAAAKAKAGRTVAGRTAVAANPLGSLISQLSVGMMTPAQMNVAARGDVNAQIAAERAALQSASKEARDDAYRQAQASEGFSKALLGFAAHDRAAIENAYGAAAGSLSSLGASLGGEMQGAEQGALAASQADVNRLAPGGQVPTYVPSGEGAANVQGLTSGAAGALGQMGTGYSEEALGRALASGIQGRDLADRYRYEGTKTNREYLDKLAQLQATRPKLYSDALAQRQQSRNQQLATLISALSLQTGTAQDVAKLGLDRAKLKASIGLDLQKQTAKQMADRGLTPTGQLLPDYYRDPRSGRVLKLPSGTVIGPKGLPVKLSTPRAKGGKQAKPPSLYDWAKTQERMMRGGEDRLGIGADSKGKVELWWSQKNIEDYLRKQYGQSFVNTYGQPKQVDQMVKAVAATLFTKLKERRKGAAPKGGAATGGVKSF
jgi:hypothetical protein